jgi:hypothetical protein
MPAISADAQPPPKPTNWQRLGRQLRALWWAWVFWAVSKIPRPPKGSILKALAAWLWGLVVHAWAWLVNRWLRVRVRWRERGADKAKHSVTVRAVDRASPAIGKVLRKLRAMDGLGPEVDDDDGT